MWNALPDLSINGLQQQLTLFQATAPTPTSVLNHPLSIFTNHSKTTDETFRIMYQQMFSIKPTQQLAYSATLEASDSSTFLIEQMQVVLAV